MLSWSYQFAPHWVNALANKNPNLLVVVGRNWQADSKICKHKGPRIAKKLLKKNKSTRFTLQKRTFYKARVI